MNSTRYMLALLTSLSGGVPLIAEAAPATPAKTSPAPAKEAPAKNSAESDIIIPPPDYPEQLLRNAKSQVARHHGDPRYVAELGLLERDLGKWLDAEEHLASALRNAGASSWVSNNSVSLEQALSDVRLHVATLEIEGTPGGVVFVDSISRGELPLPEPLKVEPGTRVVQLAGLGKEAVTTKLHLAGGQRERISLTLEAAGNGKAMRLKPLELQAAPDSEPPGWWRRAAPWLLAGTSVPILAAGGYLIAKDGTPGCDAPAGAICNTNNATMVPGIALLGVGLATDLFAVWLAGRSDHPVKISLLPSGMLASGRF